MGLRRMLHCPQGNAASKNNYKLKAMPEFRQDRCGLTSGKGRIPIGMKRGGVVARALPSVEAVFQTVDVVLLENGLKALSGGLNTLGEFSMKIAPFPLNVLVSALALDISNAFVGEFTFLSTWHLLVSSLPLNGS